MNFPFKQHVHATTYLILHCVFICSLQVKLVTEAIKMDDAGDLKGAAKLYCEAMAFFLPAIECMSYVERNFDFSFESDLVLHLFCFPALCDCFLILRIPLFPIRWQTMAKSFVFLGQ